MLQRTLSSLALLLAAGLLTACETEVLHSYRIDAEGILVHVSGGFAGVDYTLVLNGETGELVGESCASGCDFQAGTVLRILSQEELTEILGLFGDAGIRGLDGTDFGDQCCDQFHFQIHYHDGEVSSSVKGSSELLPQDLREAAFAFLALLDGPRPLVVALDGGREGWPRDPLQIESPSIQGDLLSVKVAYGGGCRVHAIQGVAHSGWMKSNPVQVRVLLSHEDFDDPCDAWLTQDLSFDLTPLKTAYQEAYGTGQAETIIRVLLEDPLLASPLGAWVLEYHF